MNLRMGLVTFSNLVNCGNGALSNHLHDIVNVSNVHSLGDNQVVCQEMLLPASRNAVLGEERVAHDDDGGVRKINRCSFAIMRKVT